MVNITMMTYTRHETTSKTKAKYVHIYLHKDGLELVKSETLEKLKNQDLKSILENNKDKIYLNIPDDSVNRSRLSEIKVYDDSILLHSYGYIKTFLFRRKNGENKNKILKSKPRKDPKNSRRRLDRPKMLRRNDIKEGGACLYSFGYLYGTSKGL